MMSHNVHKFTLDVTYVQKVIAAEWMYHPYHFEMCNNKIEYLSEVYPDGGKVSTYRNAVIHNHIDEMLSFSWSPGERFSLQTSAMLGYNWFQAPSLAQKNDGIGWSFDLSSNVDLWKGAM